MEQKRTILRIRLTLAAFAAALILSGATAIFPLEGLRLLGPLYAQGSTLHQLWPDMAEWLSLVRQALEQTYAVYPFLAYGYDWLAFGHFIIAIPFILAIRDPVGNGWVIPFGIAACLLVLPHALVFGAFRGIPLFWRLVDTLFGIGGLVLLLLIRSGIRHIRISTS